MNVGHIRVVALGALLAGCARYTVIAATPVVQARVRVAVASPTGTELPEVPAVLGARLNLAAAHAVLDAHGDWSDDATFGRVWFPAVSVVGADFVPYVTAGRWVVTDGGWYWLSGYPWGWVVFHYGRWVRIDGAWAWAPGARFAPAWVDWRLTDDRVAWAPLPPLGASGPVAYAYCPLSALGGEDFWTATRYGDGIEPEIAAVRSQALVGGFGGAHYAWGPDPARVAAARRGAAPGAGVLVSIRDAWRAEFTPRAGAPSANASSGADGRGLSVRASTPPLPWPADANRPDPVRLRDTVVLSTAPPPPAARPTISLGTTEPAAETVYSTAIAPAGFTASPREPRPTDPIVTSVPVPVAAPGSGGPAYSPTWWGSSGVTVAVPGASVGPAVFYRPRAAAVTPSRPAAAEPSSPPSVPAQPVAAGPAIAPTPSSLPTQLGGYGAARAPARVVGSLVPAAPGLAAPRVLSSTGATATRPRP